MDKQKMIVIVGDDFKGLSKELVAMGERLHMDIEVVPISDTLIGKQKRPDVCFIDEVSMPDFGPLEERISGLYDVVVEGGGRVITGRTQRRFEPAFHDLPVDKDHREQMKELFYPFAYGTGRFFGGLDNIPRRAIKEPAFAMPYGKQEAADHPSRKREPKGPRGKWGKL